MTIRAPQRRTEPDGTPVDVFALPTDAQSLEALLRDLFENHWSEIVFGPIIQGAAFEIHVDRRADAHRPARRLSHRRFRAHAFPRLHRRDERPAQPADAAGARACTGARRARSCIAASRNMRANVLEPAAVQRRGRAAARRAVAQSLPSSGNGENSAGARLVAARLWDALRARWLGLARARSAGSSALDPLGAPQCELTRSLKEETR